MATDPSTIRRRGGPWPYVAAIAVFIIYCVWIGWPYLKSIVVRDAAVTTWSQVASAPIDGTVTFIDIRFGEPIGADGLIATIENEHMSDQSVKHAMLQVRLARAHKAEVQELLRNIEILESERRDFKAQYAELFREQLDTMIGMYEAEIEVTEKRLETIRTIAERRNRLAERGVGSVDTADEAALRVDEVHLAIQVLRSKLRDARQRRAAAERGIFLNVSGENPDWVQETRTELKIEKKEARFALREAEAALESAEAELANARANLDRLMAAEIRAEPGALLWERMAVTGMAVQTGDPIAEWIDCSRLFVDMPTSDAQAALIKLGDPATVVLEGSRGTLSAKVALVRGGASVLGVNELASLAKGRQPGDAQVLLELDATGSDFDGCPVGRSAFVDFPGVGVLDIIRARLRI